MSEQISFDRAKGFVALPVEVLEIDMTPGAFRLLVELCRMANLEGYCWPSLDQLSDRMGRSKSAISGYVKELREASLVDTETQKTANGYNYRLKYRVTFWAKWRASLKGAVPQKTERSVQHAERLRESKNQSHLKQPSPLAKDRLGIILNDWVRCFSGAPYPTASVPPSEKLLVETDIALAEIEAGAVISADIEAALLSFWHKRSVDVPSKLVAEQVVTLSHQCPSPQELEALIKGLARAWQPHWRRPPEMQDFIKMVATAKVTTVFQRRQLLKTYRNRWQLAQNALRNPVHSGSLASTKKVAA